MKMKKFIALLTVAGMTATMAVGCGSSSNETSEVPLYTLLKNHEAREIYDKHFLLKLLSFLLSVLP